jgi:type I restriction enzyme M protein
MLFVERCIDWLAPGGRLGIVLPKGALDTTDPHLATRNFLFSQCRVVAVVSCHKNTFQPYTGTRTALLVVEKKDKPTAPAEGRDYPVFMAVSRKIGQDSEGEPIFRLDDEGRPTSELDQDLDDIFVAWEQFNSGALTPSEYVFSVPAAAIDPQAFNINPQHYLPSLNESLRQALLLGDRPGWTASTIGTIAESVYKGARFKREDLETDEVGPETRIYFTPAALLQERGESAKRWDLSKVPEARRRILERHVLRRGQLLITRSGTIGRVLIVSEDQAGHIGSDDLIRVEIEDEALRFYVFGYLKSKLGQDQMKRNEYGTIQQHLEPRHVRDIVIPIPDDRTAVERIARELQESVFHRERSSSLESAALEQLRSMTAASEAELAEPDDVVEDGSTQSRLEVRVDPDGDG